MPINIPDQLPAVELLEKENIFIMDESRASQQDIRPLKIIIVNLMPIKVTTETDLIRLLSNTPLQIEIEFLRMKGHKSKNFLLRMLPIGMNLPRYSNGQGYMSLPRCLSAGRPKPDCIIFMAFRNICFLRRCLEYSNTVI